MPDARHPAKTLNIDRSPIQALHSIGYKTEQATLIIGQESCKTMQNCCVPEDIEKYVKCSAGHECRPMGIQWCPGGRGQGVLLRHELILQSLRSRLFSEAARSSTGRRTTSIVVSVKQGIDWDGSRTARMRKERKPNDPSEGFSLFFVVGLSAYDKFGSSPSRPIIKRGSIFQDGLFNSHFNKRKKRPQCKKKLPHFQFTPFDSSFSHVRHVRMKLKSGRLLHDYTDTIAA